MDYPALLAALPQATVDAVSGTPQGLTSTSYVTVASDRPSPTETSWAWWVLPPETDVVGDTLAGRLVAYRFELRFTRAAATNAVLEVWANQVLAHFHGRAEPSGISGHLTTTVRILSLRELPGEPDAECVLLVSFTGLETPNAT